VKKKRKWLNKTKQQKEEWKGNFVLLETNKKKEMTIRQQITIVLYVGTPWSKCVVGVPILFTPSWRKLLNLQWIDCITGNLLFDVTNVCDLVCTNVQNDSFKLAFAVD
jgi:hypothetical protein